MDIPEQESLLKWVENNSDIKKYTPAEITKLTKTQVGRTKLLKSCFKFVRLLAMRYSTGYGNSVTVSDLYQEALMAICKKIHTYDESHGVTFLGFIVRIAMRAMTLEFHSNQWTVKKPQTYAKKSYREYRIKKNTKKFKDVYPHEIIVEITDNEIRRFKNASLVVVTEKGHNFSDDYTSYKVFPSSSHKFTERIYAAKAIKSISKYLTEREKKVIKMYYFKDIKLAEIGEHLGFCKERIAQIKNEALRKMRQEFKKG